MSFEPKLYPSDDGSHYDGLASPSGERAPLGEPEMPLWDDAAQLDLPADLAALAEQLRDDAHYLAQCHPADATPQQRAAAWVEVQKSAAPKSRFAWVRWWASGVAAAAVVMGASWMGWQLNERQDARRESVAVATSPSVSAHESATELPVPLAAAPAIHETEISASDEPSGPRILRLPENSPPRVIPAGFLQDVSGPELDAMLELLNEQTDAGLSI